MSIDCHWEITLTFFIKPVLRFVFLFGVDYTSPGYMEQASPGRVSLLWCQAKIWRESCGALSFFGSVSRAGSVNAIKWKNSARLTAISILHYRDPCQPGWPGCRVIAKLVLCPPSPPPPPSINTGLIDIHVPESRRTGNTWITLLLPEFLYYSL